MPSDPSACRWCGLSKEGHMGQWNPTVGWHAWAEPTKEQRYEAIRANAAQRTNPGASTASGHLDEECGVVGCSACAERGRVEPSRRPHAPALAGAPGPTTDTASTAEPNTPRTTQVMEEWGVRVRSGRVMSCGSRDDAEAFADGWRGGERTIVHRYIGPWEPADLDGKADR